METFVLEVILIVLFSNFPPAVIDAGAGAGAGAGAAAGAIAAAGIDEGIGTLGLLFVISL